MDDSNITMEEYIRLEEEKARKRGKVFNWETYKYGKIWYDEDVLDLRSAENEFPAIVFNDSLTSNETLFCEPTVSSLNNNELDFRISFDEFDDADYTNEFPAIVYNDALTSKSDFSTEPTLCPQRIDKFDLNDETSLSEYDEVEQSILYFNDLFPFNIVNPDDLKSDKGTDENKIDMIQSSRGNENANKLLKESHDMVPLPPRDQTRVASLSGFGREDKDGVYTRVLQACRIGDEMGLDMAGTLCIQLGEDEFGAYWLGSERLIPDKGDLSDYWVEISSDMDFLRGAPSYTYIKDLVRRLCHRAANVPYLSAQYLFRHVEGRKSSARLLRGHFIKRLAHHFSLVSNNGLRGLSVVARELPLIDMGELDDAASAPEAAEDALAINKGAQAVPAPVQAPQPPPPPPVTGRTMP
ncbi:hypothetical protein Tco_1228398 [Tanacetum coccineum]